MSQLLNAAFVESGSELARAVNDAGSSEPALRSLEPLQLIELVRDADLPLGRQDDIWGAVIRCHRRGPSCLWGALVLEMLAPALVELATNLDRILAPELKEDFNQQLVTEALAAAAAVPLDKGVRFLKRRIVLRTTTGITRWLSAQVNGMEDGPVETPDRVLLKEEGEFAELVALLELTTPALRREDIDLILDSVIRGETLVGLAERMGVTPNALRCRRRRALSKMRLLAAA
jgi:hypothetical protein